MKRIMMAFLALSLMSIAPTFSADSVAKTEGKFSPATKHFATKGALLAVSTFALSAAFCALNDYKQAEGYSKALAASFAFAAAIVNILDIPEDK